MSILTDDFIDEHDMLSILTDDFIEKIHLFGFSIDIMFFLAQTSMIVLLNMFIWYFIVDFMRCLPTVISRHYVSLPTTAWYTKNSVVPILLSPMTPYTPHFGD